MGLGEAFPSHFLADQLTLSRPRGAHSPHPVLLAPEIFGLYEGPGLLLLPFCNSAVTIKDLYQVNIGNIEKDV